MLTGTCKDCRGLGHKLGRQAAPCEKCSGRGFFYKAPKLFKAWRDGDGAIIATFIDGIFYVKPIPVSQVYKLEYYRPVFEAINSQSR